MVMNVDVGLAPEIRIQLADLQRKPGAGSSTGRCPGKLMIKSRCPICGEAILGAHGSVFVGTEIGTGYPKLAYLLVYHDASYGNTRKVAGTCKPCSSGIPQQVRMRKQQGGVFCWDSVTGNVEQILDLIEVVYAVRSIEAQQVIDSTRHRLAALQVLERKKLQVDILVAKFNGNSIRLLSRKPDTLTKADVRDALAALQRVIVGNQYFIYPGRYKGQSVVCPVSEESFKVHDALRIKFIPQVIADGIQKFGVVFIDLALTVLSFKCALTDCVSVFKRLISDLEQRKAAPAHVGMIVQACGVLPPGMSPRRLKNALRDICKQVALSTRKLNL